MPNYVVTGYVKSIGRRDVISKPMTLSKAQAFKKRINDEMKVAIPAYRWVKTIKVEPVT